MTSINQKTDRFTAGCRCRGRRAVFCAVLVLVNLGVTLAILIAGLTIWRTHIAARVVQAASYADLRRFLDGNRRGMFNFDPDVSYVFKPNFSGSRHGSHRYSHRTNSRGLLGTAEILDDSEVRKVLFLGDSVTYGDGVAYEKIFTSCLQTTLGGVYQVANGSCPGWSSNQEIAYHRKYLADIDWALVVLVFCPNDLLAFEWVYGTEYEFEMAADLVQLGGLGGVTASLGSLRLAGIRLALCATRSTRPLAQLNNTCLHAWDSWSWPRYERDVLSPFFDDPRRHPLAVVVVPLRDQLTALLRGTRPAVALYPQARLRGICRKHGIPFLDANEVLAGTNDPAGFFIDALHLSDLRHRRVAEYLRPRIEQLALRRPKE